MKTLKNHTILYDGACPMCNLYTKAFVDSGMLEKDSRLPYQEMPADMAAKVDCQRARDEIALVDTTTGEVHYGVQSLMLVIGNSFRFFRPVFRSPFVIAIASCMYKFISFNRRVIVPSRETGSASDPSFSLPYRLLFLMFTWLITAAILNAYSPLMKGIVPQGSPWREYLVCGGQMLWQSAVIRFTDPRKTWDYLGTMMTVSFAGGLLLWIIKVFSFPFAPNSFFYASCFMLVAACMLAEHIRRTRILGLSSWLSVSWIAYRLFVLIIIVA